jgi:hypothetical protein
MMGVNRDSVNDESSERTELTELLEVIHSDHPEEVLDLPNSDDTAGADSIERSATEDDPTALYDLGVLNASPPQ